MRRSLRSFTSPFAAAWVVGFLAATALPSQAASSTASSISDSITTSVGSVSASIERSSRSSAHVVAQIEGDYTITALAAVAERPGMLRVALQSKPAEGSAEGEDFFLYLPEATVAQAQLAVGQGVTATARVYGTEFSKTEGRQAFFLVLKDEWARELNSQALHT